MGNAAQGNTEVYLSVEIKSGPKQHYNTVFQGLSDIQVIGFFRQMTTQQC